jgi:hypothetical protein
MVMHRTGRQRVNDRQNKMKRAVVLSSPSKYELLPRIMRIAALMIIMTAACALSAEVDIDYSHNVIGTGTVMTDFKMGAEDDTLATGRVRGSGEIVNRYAFISNDSENVSIKDQFLFEETPVIHEISASAYPQMTMRQVRFRLVGTVWAPRINLSAQND